MNNMNFKIPYFGKKGSIKDIKENNKFYLVYRYGLTEKEETLFYVPKNKNNLKDLLDNYYSDLKEYLDINANKYETTKKTRLKKDINLGLIKIMSVASLTMLLASIPLLNTHNQIGFIGVTLDTLAIPTAVYAIGEFVKLHNDTKKAKFIKKYNQLRHKYQKGIRDNVKVNEKTVYHGLDYNKNKDHTNDLSKVKILKQDTRKNAA